MYIRAISRAALLCSTILTFNAFAAGDRADYDLDNDGLIEINDLADLNEIRNHLDGAALYGDSTGCPEEGCNGFELTTDLDFDTNGDGQMDELDTYWNAGQGWEPIGSSSSNTFSADFNGNGHQISNLYIDRSGTIGLFGTILGTSSQLVKITQVAITGQLTSITGSSYSAGLLAGDISYAEVDRIFASGFVSSQRYAGGLAGIIFGSTVSNVFSSAAILAGQFQGGLTARPTDNTLSRSLSTGYVKKGHGLAGYSFDNNNANLYWATDTSGQATIPSINASYFGALLSELQCPASSDSDTCTDSGTLYKSWSSEVWDFGTAQQLPALIMGDRVYRDSDGDGALDGDDAYPDTFAASLDTDEDGYIDSYTLGCDAICRVNSGLIIDAFPSSAAAYLDGDLDGLVDEWADGCDATCQTNSGLTYDDYPDDRDNDGITDTLDTDDNNDGIIDADADSDGLIDIASLEELNAIRFSLDGSGQRLSEFYDIDSSGCPGLISEGLLEQRCAGYELVADLDFDTNSDGQMNELDNYWNDGEGWEPIGADSVTPFTTNFHGNGHQIRNLYIDRTGNAGLFGYIEGYKVQPIKISEAVLTGPMTSITGGFDTGVFAGAILDAKVDRLFISGTVKGGGHVGGLVGRTLNSTVSNVFSSAVILEGYDKGGIIGRLYDADLSNSLATGYIEGRGGLLGASFYDSNEFLYWTTDTTGQSTSSGTNASYFGALLSELQCPAAPNDDTCTDKGTLYENWDSEVWDFSSYRQLPGLIMNGVVYRDSDGDGALDEDDAYPDTFAASLDTDKDGYPDNYSRGCSATCVAESGLFLDAFPENSAGWLDADLDGLVDKWADGCDTTCQTNSGLFYDDYPDDRDNDGITDVVDTDDNNDGIIDADADSDGFIDIASLEELNAIRFAMDGSGQAMIEGSLPDASGCPIILWQGIALQRCHGYELVADLDFDTNGDGQMNELDTYWNDGEGWEPIGANSLNPFTTNFHGNGHQIRNLYIDRTGNAGLFGYILGGRGDLSTITELAITGPLTSVTGSPDAGLLASRVSYAEIDRVFISGGVSAPSYAGGLAGYISWSTIYNVFSSASIMTGNIQGGLIGRISASSLANNLSTGYAENRHGLLGYSYRNNNDGSYWATDASGQTTSPGTNASYSGALLSELQCPTSSDNNTCTDSGILYENWNSQIWDFGTGQQLPGLIMGDRIYRDSDGDGTPDEEDAFPNIFAASLDADKDGYPDSYSLGCSATCGVTSGLFLDAYPENSAGGLDRDLDGLIDEWASGCDITCQISSGLTLDDYPGDWDNDGIADAVDTDNNNDGIVDADADSDGLIDIASLEELNAIRFALDGSGQVMIEGNSPDTSGCPITRRQDIAQPRCHGYELVSDLDFDTNGDGQMNELDTYWSDGEGWEPIGSSSSNAFTADFHGNGHQIRNLYIDRPTIVGLFGFIEGTLRQPVKITQVAITGPMTSVTSASGAGALAGYVSYAEIENVFVSGVVNTRNWEAGGLASKVYYSTVNNVFSSAAILSGLYQGGLTGSLVNSVISNSLSTGYVANGSRLLYHGTGYNNESSYWATDASGQATSAGTNPSSFGAHLSELQCPTTPNDDTCTDKGTLYENWNNEVWDFGSDRQLPGLIMNEMIYRDSDGDGTLDVNYSPTIELLLTQDGREESTIVEGIGDVTIEVIITDENGWDYHSVEWSSNDINLADSYELGNSITFSSDGLVAGDYTISVTVTDTGIPQLSDTAEMTIRVISNVDPAPSASSDEGGSGGGGSGGGAILWLLAILSAPLVLGRVRA